MSASLLRERDVRALISKQRGGGTGDVLVA